MLFHLRRQKVYSELELYIDWLHDTSFTEQVVSPEKTRELLEYYRNRPELANYTIQRELPRLKNYQVMVGPGTVVDDIESVKKALSEWEDDAAAGSILTRCANQSLLADLLRIMTGPDTYIRPQFMATASAKACQFTLDPSTLTIKCISEFDLKFPASNGEQWSAAQLDVEVEFTMAEDNPVLKYKVDSVKPLFDFYGDNIFDYCNNKGHDMLQSTAKFLVEMQPRTPLFFSQKSALMEMMRPSRLREFITQIEYEIEFSDETVGTENNSKTVIAGC